MANKQSSLCWYCKRIIDENLVCPWVDDGVRVPGWKISDVHKISGSCIRFGPAKTCNVIECPLFVRQTDSITLNEYLNNIAKEIGVAYSTAHGKPKRLLEKYTKKTGKEHPEWVIHELMNKDD